MRLLITLAVLVVVAISLTRARPVHELADPATLVLEVQPGAVALDGTLPPDPPQSSQIDVPQADVQTVVRPSNIDSLSELHQRNDRSFRKALGFGHRRGDQHELLGDGTVRFLVETNGLYGTQQVSGSKAGTGSPYGLWGALGTGNAAQKPDPDTDHSFQRLSRKQVKDQHVESWQVEFIQLVSIERLSAYDDDQLPTMEMLADESIGTRSLDSFELSSVDELQAGEQLVIERSDHLIQMVGAIRAGNKCLECHSVEKGDLLGAFTYRFKRDN